jgi:hypothetical protein
MKPWPKDSVVLVCANADAARREMMESANPAECSDCGGAVMYDSRSMRKILELEQRTRPKVNSAARPVKIICEACSAGYDIGQCDVIGDHTGGKDDVYATPKWRGVL